MVSTQPDAADPIVCPLLGLAGDRNTHATFPHPSHRCFAVDHPASPDARAQSARCLTRDFLACDRFRTHLDHLWQSAQASG
jgi:hypothetical protein